MIQRTLFALAILTGASQPQTVRAEMLPVATSTASTATCRDTPGLQSAVMQDTRFLVVGETHGTTEIPALFGDIVCDLAKTRPIIVAFEWSERSKADIDAYMQSDGGDAARKQLMNSRIWSRDFADGRSSVAMLNLLSELRNLRQRGANLKIVAVQPAGNFQLLSQDYYEIAFAANIVRAATTEPQRIP